MTSNCENLIAALCSITPFDIRQAIGNIKSKVMKNETPLGFDLFIAHSENLNLLKHLVMAVPKTKSDEKQSNETDLVSKTIEGLITDICFPFLQSFNPSFDGRTDLVAAVLVVCDLTLACMERSSDNITTKALELCHQSLLAFRQEAILHTTDNSQASLDIACAIELLNTTLEVEVSCFMRNNQNEEQCEQIFAESVLILPHLNEKLSNRLISSILTKLLKQQINKKDIFLQGLWNSVVSDMEKKPVMEPSSHLQQHLMILCSLADYFFPLTADTVYPDIRSSNIFWNLVQQGLYDANPATRKRAMYILKRIIDTCEKFDHELNIASLNVNSIGTLPHFWWCVKQQQSLSKIWEDFILLMETLEEKQTHVIKPILPRIQSLTKATTLHDGHILLHTSWLVTVLTRAFHHESIFIVRWAAETTLYLDFCTVPVMKQDQQSFLTFKLLQYLQDLKLYFRPEGLPGSCSRVGSGLLHFFPSCFSALASNEEKVTFLLHVLHTIKGDNWASVPLVFITQGLSCIKPCLVLNSQGLLLIRDIIKTSLVTLENFTRGAIECFLTKTILNLVDKSVVPVSDFFETLTLMDRDESLQRSTHLWSVVVSWLLDAQSDPTEVGWTWADLYNTLISLKDSYFSENTDTATASIAESLKVSKIVRLLVFLADCEMSQKHTIVMDEEKKPSVLTAILSCSVDIINSINSRVYMPTLKADRAISLLVTCVKEVQNANCKETVLHKELHSAVVSCWSELILYVQRRTLQDVGSEWSVDLDLLIFYEEALTVLGGLLSAPEGLNSLKMLAVSCVKCLSVQENSEPEGSSTLKKVAAGSLLAAVAKTVNNQLCGCGREQIQKCTDGISYGIDFELMQLSDFLWQSFPKLSITSTIIKKQDGIVPAQMGRLVCQYMKSVWECLHILVSYQPAFRSASSILDSAFECFSVSSGQSDVPIMLTVEKIMNELVKDVEGERVVLLCKTVWSKVQEEVKSWSYWVKMERYISMVFQPAILVQAPDSPIGTYVAEVLETLFKIGRDKAGIVNFVMDRLCRLFKQPGGVELSKQMVPTLVDALMFGSLHKRGEKLWQDVCMYLETLKEACSVNETMPKVNCMKNDLFVRLTTANYLSALNPQASADRDLVLKVLKEAWLRYIDIAKKTTNRQYNNSLEHRQKHRLLLLFPLLSQFITQESCKELWDNCWQGLVLECHPSVRHNLEWLILRLAHRFPSLLDHLWQYFDQFSDKRNVSLCSLLNIISQLGPELPYEIKEQFYSQAMPLVLPWTMAHHFNTRLHGLACMLKLWEQCKRFNLRSVIETFGIVQNCFHFTEENSNSSKVVLKLLDNYFYNTFHFLLDFSIETIFYTLPRLACISDDEWIHPDLFLHWDSSWQTDFSSHLLPLYNSTKKLSLCPPGPWRSKAQAENDEEISESTDGDVQKKIIPWRLMTPDSHVEQEYSHRRKGHKPGGLVLVTSLINKLPNLGGLCRTSEIFGVSEFVIGNLCYLSDQAFQRLSVTAEKWIPITEVPAFRLVEYLEEKKRESYTLVGVEQTANSVYLTQYKFPKKTLLLLGNEKEGIPPDLLQQLDVCVEIPQQGIIRSLNVHVSGALLLWEYSRQHMTVAQ